MTFCYQKLTCFHGGEEHGRDAARLPAPTGRSASRASACASARAATARIRRVLARDVHRFTVVSDELGARSRANGIRVDRTVHNAIRAAARSCRARRPWPPSATRVGLEGKRVLAIGGRLHEQKGVGAAVRACWRSCAPSSPTLRLLVMGKRDVYDREFAALAARAGRGRAHRAHRLARRRRAAVRLRRRRRARHALDLLRHLRAGQPRGHGARQARRRDASSAAAPRWSSDGVTGFVANPFDIAAFAERIARAAGATPSWRARMGAAGRERCPGALPHRAPDATSSWRSTRPPGGWPDWRREPSGRPIEPGAGPPAAGYAGDVRRGCGNLTRRGSFGARRAA